MDKITPPLAADIIRAKMAKDGRKLIWLAQSIGTSQAMLSSYLAGRHIPQFERRAALAGVLGLPEIAEETPWRT